ncbi:hypothetical protein [Tautonia plasticadhaerens]|uniref:Uncharacterized protein n=1 Tax=Tautonia plasticadhaerens TaxID=2527974 RepID=A0A518H4C9_9BACT|nr:hypothetical protein [Tautonia plasticadhaerens]QDV35704.1 hypothetical protein ElP_36090 [Tautonia plasticadhaerens]
MISWCEGLRIRKSFVLSIPYEEELDLRDTLAAEHGPIADAEPELFDLYQYHFVWPRLGDRRSNLTIVERKGHNESWKTLVVEHRGKVRFRVERHLDQARYWYHTVWRKPNVRPRYAYWLALPHGPRTRNVTIDLDNHGRPLVTFRKGYPSITPVWKGTNIYPPDPPILELPCLSVEVLDKARRLHATLGPEARWCLSSRSLGFHVILPLDRLVPSATAVDTGRRFVTSSGLPSTTEVYPWGNHAHRLPFGLDFCSFGPDGRLLTGFQDQMRMYLNGPPAPEWDALLEGLLRHWRDLYEEASYHVVGVRTWRDLHARMKATRKDIDRWRSGGSVAVATKPTHQPPASTPSPGTSCKADAPPDWIAYVGNLKAKERHYWLALVQDLAINGLPCDDCIDRAGRELGRFLIHVQGFEPVEAAELVYRWAEAKSNGYITRLQNGKASDVQGQVRRIVNHVANEEDFGGRLARMRSKITSGRYRNPIDLPALMGAPSSGRTSTPSSPPGREEERVILVEPPTTQQAIEAGWTKIEQRMLPYQPKRLNQRQRWWATVRSIVNLLEANGGEAPISKALQSQLAPGSNGKTTKAIHDALVAAGVLGKGRRRYAQATVYTLLAPCVTSTPPGT